MANYLRDAIRYQQEMEEANRPATVNSLMARKAAAIKQNASTENMLTQYAQTMPQNWQQFVQNMAQAYPTPATGASRDQILSAVKQAAVNAGPLMMVWHGSPKGEILGVPKLRPHDENGIPSFSVTESPGTANQYAKNANQRHSLAIEDPTITKFNLGGVVSSYEDVMAGTRKMHGLEWSSLPTKEQIIEYANKKGISAFDLSKTLGLDEIQVINPNFLQKINSFKASDFDPFNPIFYPVIR